MRWNMTDSTKDSDISVLMKIDSFNTLVYWKDKYNPFVVALYFDESKPDGSKWSSGTYFHTLKVALKYIKKAYGVDVYKR